MEVLDTTLLLGFGVLLLMPFVAVIAHAVGDVWFRVQAHLQQTLQAHNVTIELSDSGGYQVVE